MMRCYTSDTSTDEYKMPTCVIQTYHMKGLTECVCISRVCVKKKKKTNRSSSFTRAWRKRLVLVLFFDVPPSNCAVQNLKKEVARDIRMHTVVLISAERHYWPLGWPLNLITQEGDRKNWLCTNFCWLSTHFNLSQQTETAGLRVYEELYVFL